MTLILERSFGANVFENLSQFFVFETALQRWYQCLGLFRCLRTQITQSGQLEFMQLLLHQQTGMNKQITLENHIE